MKLRSMYATSQPTSLLALALQKSRSLVKSKHPHYSAMTPVMSPFHRSSRPWPTRNPRTFLHFLRRVLLPSSSRTVAVCTDEPRNPLDVSATSLLPRPLLKYDEDVSVDCQIDVKLTCFMFLVSTLTGTTHHPILRHQYFRTTHIPLTSIMNLMAPSYRSCIAYH
ncbi:hypothetical protein BD769DRAFT_334774 [Suillus cothurnatus]|nr:hypothetical protein BD769DRAFT_334774 [Suillus cothurnatus]